MRQQAGAAGLRSRAVDLREEMDDPGCDPARLRRTLRRFPVVNRVVAGWSRTYRLLLREQLLSAPSPARILDIGCGGGDVLRHLVRLGRRDGLAIEAVGIDPDPQAIAVAEETPVTGVTHRLARSGDLRGLDGERFDVVVSNHLLHHLSEPELEGLLADSEALTRGIAVHADIARGRLAYSLFSVASLPVAPGTMLRSDGLRSIRRSFTADELAARLPAGWSAARPAPFRVAAVHRPEEERWPLR